MAVNLLNWLVSVVLMEEWPALVSACIGRVVGWLTLACV